jgi:hypothetical protein
MYFDMHTDLVRILDAWKREAGAASPETSEPPISSTKRAVIEFARVFGVVWHLYVGFDYVIPHFFCIAR